MTLLLARLAVLSYGSVIMGHSLAAEPKSVHVVANVNGQDLLAAEVERVLAQLPLVDGDDGRLHDATEVAIQRILVLDYLRDRKLGATKDEIDLAMSRWVADVVARDSDAKQAYAISHMNDQAMRRRFAWKIGWDRYRRKHLSDESLAQFFADNKQQFDGTRVRVAHLLLDRSETGLELTNSLRQRIVARDITFEEAVKINSVGKSAAAGGELGWITATGPMTKRFTKAAFGLNVDQLSEPVQTQFGFHIIKCLEKEAGTKSFEAVLPAVRREAELRLFKTIVNRQRPKALIERMERQ